MSAAHHLGVLVAVGTIVLAGCGGTAARTTASATSTTYGKALAYAECMRSHGEPNWPDPGSNGTFELGQADLTTGSVLANAMKACARLNPIPALSKTQQRKAVAVMLKYSQCMRAHGVVNYPDPNAYGVVPASPSGVDTNSPRYQAAVHACQSV